MSAVPRLHAGLRMNVLIISDFAFINGGQAKVAIDSALGLVEQGHNVTFFAACGPADARLGEAGVRVVCLNMPDILSDPDRLRAMVSGVWNARAAGALRRELKRHDPTKTILHWHGYAKALSASVGRVILGSGFPHVYTMHEYFLACPNGGFFDYQANEICRRRPLGFDCLTTHCDVRHPAHKAWRVLRQVATHGPGGLPQGLKNIIYISETQLRVMRRYLDPGTRLHHVPNPISVTKRPRVEVEKNNLFLFVGRLNPEKGGLLFARATKKAGVEAAIIGDGVERDAIQSINPEAKIVGWIAPDEVEEWIGKARCLVFPSLWYETFGLVAYEALAKGVPVICGNWNSAVEALGSSSNGVAVRTAQVDDWVNAIEYVNNNCKSLSINAHKEYWDSPPTLSQHSKALASTYEDIFRRNELTGGAQ